MWSTWLCGAEPENRRFTGLFAFSAPHNAFHLQTFEKTQQAFLVRASFGGLHEWSFTTGQGFGFHFQIAFRVNVGRLERYMPQPDSNRVDVHSGTEQRHGCGMANTMGAHVFVAQGGRFDYGLACV